MSDYRFVRAVITEYDASKLQFTAMKRDGKRGSFEVRWDDPALIDPSESRLPRPSGGDPSPGEAILALSDLALKQLSDNSIIADKSKLTGAGESGTYRARLVADQLELTTSASGVPVKLQLLTPDVARATQAIVLEPGGIVRVWLSEPAYAQARGVVPDPMLAEPAPWAAAAAAAADTCQKLAKVVEDSSSPARLAAVRAALEMAAALLGEAAERVDL